MLITDIVAERVYVAACVTLWKRRVREVETAAEMCVEVLSQRGNSLMDRVSSGRAPLLVFIQGPRKSPPPHPFFLLRLTIHPDVMCGLEAFITHTHTNTYYCYMTWPQPPTQTYSFLSYDEHTSLLASRL